MQRTEAGCPAVTDGLRFRSHGSSYVRRVRGRIPTLPPAYQPPGARSHQPPAAPRPDPRGLGLGPPGTGVRGCSRAGLTKGQCTSCERGDNTGGKALEPGPERGNSTIRLELKGRPRLRCCFTFDGGRDFPMRPVVPHGHESLRTCLETCMTPGVRTCFRALGEARVTGTLCGVSVREFRERGPDDRDLCRSTDHLGPRILRVLALCGAGAVPPASAAVPGSRGTPPT